MFTGRHCPVLVAMLFFMIISLDVIGPASIPPRFRLATSRGATRLSQFGKKQGLPLMPGHQRGAAAVAATVRGPSGSWKHDCGRPGLPLPPGIVPHVRVVFIDLENEIGFLVFGQHLLEIFDDKGVRGAFECSDQDGIEVFGGDGCPDNEESVSVELSNKMNLV